MGRSSGDQSKASQFSSDFRRASNALEEAVHELIAGGWEDRRRRRAEELAGALAAAAIASGWKETGSVVQSIASLLAMPLGEVIAVRGTVREKLLELLDRLKDPPASETA